jgi:DNA-directed RNA polymerase subunit RPC12/RpoP
MLPGSPTPPFGARRCNDSRLQSTRVPFYDCRERFTLRKASGCPRQLRKPSRLESRLRCPKCGSHRIVIIVTVPAQPAVRRKRLF